VAILRALSPATSSPVRGADSWLPVATMIRAAREVPFDVSAAESWRSAFLADIGDARAALDGTASDGVNTISCERLRAEMTSLVALVQGLRRVSLKDVVEACERAILLEIAVSGRSRPSAVEPGTSWHAAYID